LSRQAETLAQLRAIGAEDVEAAAAADRLAADEPVVDSTLDWIWRAWHRLSDDRPYHGGGMGPAVPGRIPWTVVLAWSRHHRLSRGEMTMLDIGFAAMDATYIDWWVKAQDTAETAS
jgi:hypothetical protein